MRRVARSIQPRDGDDIAGTGNVPGRRRRGTLGRAARRRNAARATTASTSGDMASSRDRAAADDGDDVFIGGPAATTSRAAPATTCFVGGARRRRARSAARTSTPSFYADHPHDGRVHRPRRAARRRDAAGENDLIAGVEGLSRRQRRRHHRRRRRPQHLAGSARRGPDRRPRRASTASRATTGTTRCWRATASPSAPTAPRASTSSSRTTIDGPPSARPSTAIPDLQPDRDGDGVDKPLDCDDLDATTRPGAFDRPGDGVDQDCDGADDVDLDRDRDGFLAGFDCDDGNAADPPGREGEARQQGRRGLRQAWPTRTPPSRPPSCSPRGSRRDRAGRARPRRPRRPRAGPHHLQGQGLRAQDAQARAGGSGPSRSSSTELVRGQRLRPGAKLAVRITRRDGVRKTVQLHGARRASRRSSGPAARAPRAGGWRDAEARAPACLLAVAALLAAPGIAHAAEHRDARRRRR